MLCRKTVEIHEPLSFWYMENNDVVFAKMNDADKMLYKCLNKGNHINKVQPAMHIFSKKPCSNRTLSFENRF